jgi:toxin ParE1/3/4
VRKREIRFLATANSDLKAIYDFIAEASGYSSIAEKFVDRIFQFCETLSDFPEVGAARDDLSPGIRLIPFERKATIFHRVLEGEVQITNVFYRGRDYNENSFEP